MKITLDDIIEICDKERDHYKKEGSNPTECKEVAASYAHIGELLRLYKSETQKIIAKMLVKEFMRKAD
jgi:hypothetical protein